MSLVIQAPNVVIYERIKREIVQSLLVANEYASSQSLKENSVKSRKFRTNPSFFPLYFALKTTFYESFVSTHMKKGNLHARSHIHSI